MQPKNVLLCLCILRGRNRGVTPLPESEGSRLVRNMVEMKVTLM